MCGWGSPRHDQRRFEVYIVGRPKGSASIFSLVNGRFHLGPMSDFVRNATDITQ